MAWCFKCGVSGDKVLLFDAVSDKGVVKICKNCALEEDLPILKKPEFKPFQSQKPILPRDLKINMSEESQRMYERLSRLSGVKLKEKKTEEEQALEKQNRSLGEIANKKFEEEIRKHPGNTSELINNFHWVVMRARRLKKLTQEQFAKEIREPESAIKMLEQGVVPKDSFFIKKVEDYLGIKISEKTPEIKEGGNDFEVSQDFGGYKEDVELKFDSSSARNLTISDLVDMKKKREEEEKKKTEKKDSMFDEEDFF